mmetsp:Transcript_21443/g.43015  ORF Transcript_21443/g.43015 Transcript_21443/m.43015 type:complete len:91 (-) Transcript_21443:202-474(-)
MRTWLRRHSANNSSRRFYLAAMASNSIAQRVLPWIIATAAFGAMCWYDKQRAKNLMSDKEIKKWNNAVTKEADQHKYEISKPGSDAGKTP